MKLAVIFLSVITLIVSTAFAQMRQIKGTVYNAETKVPIPNVTIAIQGLEIQSVSNENGEFAMTIPANFSEIVFSNFSGLVLSNVVETSTDNYIIYLTEFSNLLNLTLEELMNLDIVTAGKTEQKITSVPASVVIMSKKDIEHMGYSSLEEIFSHITGLYYSNNQSFLGATIGVRGYMTANPSNIVVLVNGVPQQNDLHNSFSFQICPLAVEAIDRIEVVRGPMSVMYGSNAFLGAINIITNDPVAENQSVSKLSGGLGNNGNKRIVFNTKGKLNWINYALTVSYLSSDGIDKPFDLMVSDFSTKKTAWGLTNDDATSKDYFTSDQKYVNFSGSFKDVYFDMGMANAKYGQTFSMLFYLPAQCKSTFSKSAIGYRHSFSNSLTVNAKATYSRYDLLMEDNYFSTDPNGFGTESDIYSYGQYWSEKIEEEINIFYRPNKRLNMSINAYHSALLDVGDKTDAPYNNSSNLLNRSGGVVEGDRVNNLAFYTQIDYQFLDKFRIVAGGRMERMGSFDLVLYRAMYYAGHTKFSGTFSDTKFNFVPQAGLIIDVSKNHYIKLMYGEAIKLPAVWELRNNLTVGQSLEPEKIKTIEINYLAQFTKSFMANISGFRNNIQDVVLRSIILLNDNYLSYFTNGAKIETNGVEMTLIFNPLPKLKTEVSATYQTSKYNSLGMNDVVVEFSPKWLGYFNSVYNINDKLSVSVNATYTDEMEAQWDNTPINPQDPNSLPRGRYGKKVDSYFLLNANIRMDNLTFKSQKNSSQHFYFNLKVNNILDTEFHYPSTSVSAWADNGVLGFGRSAILSGGFVF